MAHLYVLECSDGTFYVGSTRDLGRRLDQHAQGLGAQYTRRRLPVRLVWCEQFERIDEAYAWEKRVQGWSHAKRAAFMTGGIEAIKGWSARERRTRATGVG